MPKAKFSPSIIEPKSDKADDEENFPNYSTTT
jgi:hypothetical protein